MKTRRKSIETSVPDLDSRERDALSPEQKQSIINQIRKPLGLHGYAGLEFLAAGAMGSKDSAHDVFFASHSEEKGGREAVAIKRFRRLENAQREFEGIRRARELGFKTFQPAGDGVYGVADDGFVLVTDRIPRFTTLNQIGWQNHFAGQEEYGEIADVLQAAGEQVGNQHLKGLIHKDLLLKNLARIPTGEFVVFDLEDAKFYGPDDDPFEFGGACVDDLKRFVGSLADYGYLATATDAVFKHEIETNLLDPYLGVHPLLEVAAQADSITAEGIYYREQKRRAISGAQAVGQYTVGVA